jgi:glutathione S-transferase
MVYHALELQLRFRDFFREEDEEKKAELKTELAESLIPKYYPILEELVGAGVPGPFIAGRRVSWHDLYLANWLEIWEENIVGQEFLDDFPALKKLKEAVFAIPAVKIYLRKRAKTVI